MTNHEKRLSQDSRELLSRIDEHVRCRFAGWFPDAADDGVPTVRGPVEIDYWSISYRLAFSRHTVFVKIPKMKMKEADLPSILRDPRALASAQTEYEGFTRIHEIENWPTGCSTVRPLAYVPEFNAILTEFSPSTDLFRQCRASITGRFGRATDERHIHDSLRSCGRWLSHFQREGAPPERIRVDSTQLAGEMRTWVLDIEKGRSESPCLQSVFRRLEQEPWSCEMPKVRNCEGFEVRNIIAGDDGAIRVVDPGRLSWSSGLEDVAHFLTSLTMLFWGTPWLWIGVSAGRNLRQSFLDGWRRNGVEVSPALLAWFEIREMVRQWADASRVVDQKPLSLTIRNFLRVTYVDTFFQAGIARHMRIACKRMNICTKELSREQI